MRGLGVVEGEGEGARVVEQSPVYVKGYVTQALAQLGVVGAQAVALLSCARASIA